MDYKGQVVNIVHAKSRSEWADQKIHKGINEKLFEWVHSRLEHTACTRRKWVGTGQGQRWTDRQTMDQQRTNR